MLYAGESNVPGAAGNLLAGSPGYFMPEAEIQRRFQDRYRSTPEGLKLQENIQRVREQLKTGTFPWQQAQYSPGAMPVGNMGALIDNAQFYKGPQLAQIPPGFDGKTIY